jgi:biotin carboxyl carrier protein
MTADPRPDIAIRGTDGDARLPDPRGVRVTFAPSAGDTGLPPLVVEPLPIPVVGTPRVAGKGVLGGTAPIPDPSPAVTPTGVRLDGKPSDATLVMLDAERARLTTAPGAEAARVLLLPPAVPPGAARGVTRREVVVDGWRVEVEIEAAARAALRERARRGRDELAHSGPTEVRAIIPGVVVSVSVAPGDEVVAGQQLLAVEAMKMQNELRAPRDGRIEKVAVAPGKTIEVGDLLLVIG